MKTEKKHYFSIRHIVFSLMLLSTMIACDTTESERDRAGAELEKAKKNLEKAGKKVEKGLENAGDKLEKATKNMGSDFEKNKDKFVASTRDEIRELDVRINKLKDRINAGAKQTGRETSEAGSEAKAKMQKELEQLELKRGNLDTQLEKLQNSTESVWQDVKKGVSDAMSDLKEAAKEVEDKVAEERKE